MVNEFVGGANGGRKKNFKHCANRVCHVKNVGSLTLLIAHKIRGWFEKQSGKKFEWFFNTAIIVISLSFILCIQSMRRVNKRKLGFYLGIKDGMFSLNDIGWWLLVSRWTNRWSGWHQNQYQHRSRWNMYRNSIYWFSQPLDTMRSLHVYIIFTRAI